MATPDGPKRPCGGGRPRTVGQSRMTRNGRVHDGSADKFAKRKTLRRHRGYPGGVDWHWRTRNQSVFDAAMASAQESGLRENCTSRLSERAEAGRKLHLSQLYVDDGSAWPTACPQQHGCTAGLIRNVRRDAPPIRLYMSGGTATAMRRWSVVTAKTAKGPTGREWHW